MDKVNVLVVSVIPYAEYMQDIAAVDPRVLAVDGTEEFEIEVRNSGLKLPEGWQGPWEGLMQKWIDLSSGRQIPGIRKELDALLVEAEVIFAVGMLPEDLLLRAPRLKWIHIGNIGIDRFLSTGIFDSELLITNSRGGVAIPIAEHVLTFMLMLAKGAPRLLANKQARRWERLVTKALYGRSVGLVGLGSVGKEVSRLAKAFGMKVIATRRSATNRQFDLLEADILYPPSDLLQMLSESDFVVIAAPLTDETRGMIGEKELHAMRPNASLINIARAPIVDQSALIKALKERWIASAGLDVFEAEPLAQDSELWQLPNVILSPHVAGVTDVSSQRIVKTFCQNLKRYLAGQPLLNVIDKQKKY